MGLALFYNWLGQRQTKHSEYIKPLKEVGAAALLECNTYLFYVTTIYYAKTLRF